MGNRDRSPIDPDYLALQVVEAMPDNAILVDEGLTSSRQMLALRPHRDRYGYHALASGGIDINIDSVRPPDCRPNSVPRSHTRLNST